MLQLELLSKLCVISFHNATAFLLLFTIVIYGCVQEPCVKRKQVNFNVKLVAKNQSGVDSVINQGSLPIRYVDHQGNWQEAQINSTGEMYPLPVDKLKLASKYVLGLKINGLTSWQDTLHILYQPRVAFISEACGFEMFFRVKQLETTTIHIDSVKLNNPLIDTSSTIHAQIYIR